MQKRGGRLCVGEHEAGSLDEIIDLFAKEAIYISPTGARISLGKPFTKPI